MRAVVCIICFIAWNTGIISQDMAPDTILNLKDVYIQSSRINHFAKGQAIIALDSMTRSEYPGATLAELIPGMTSTYVRNYGQGTLSTISFRGTSANHAGLLWNGIRISPPNIGYIDLSLVQGSFFNDISVLYGGASPLFGSGSIGGGIHLENKPTFNRNTTSVNLGISAGSYATLAAEGKGVLSRENFYSSTAFSFSNTDNDFSYKNTDGKQEKMDHAQTLRTGFIQDLAYQLRDNQYLMVSTWFQYAEREIPPTLTEDTSEAVQMDRSWRNMLIWKDFNPRNTLEAKLAYFNEFTRYVDPKASVYSVIKTQSAAASFESTWETGKNGRLFGGIQFLYEHADLDFYESPQNQQTLALYASYTHRLPLIDWQMSLNGRQEFFTGYDAPFLFSIGTEGKIWRSFSGRVSISRNFRAPTLNERYWVPGGDPGLKPETSWNEEAGISYDKIFSEALLNLYISFFNSRVENWILWLPSSGSYWEVENAQQVWSRGIEFGCKQSVTLNAFDLLLTSSYTFCKSTNEEKLFDLDASYKKQLIYTPLHRLIFKPGVAYRGFNMAFRGAFTGEVYTSKDNLSSLQPYFLVDVIASKSLNINNRYPISVQLNLNNVFNMEYQVAPYRPMPGINFLITLKAGLNLQ